MPTSAPPAEFAVPSGAEALRAAFREIHGPRLHGFALLLTLGDRSLAARLAASALAAGADRAGQLRHPERAAAWLRARVVEQMPRRRRAVPPAERRATLDTLEVDAPVADALATLDARRRAALIASTVENLDRRDVETVAGRSGADLDRLLADARRRYLAAHARRAATTEPGGGPLTDRVRVVAQRSLR